MYILYTNAVASAPTVVGSVFMRRFRLGAGIDPKIGLRLKLGSVAMGRKIKPRFTCSNGTLFFFFSCVKSAGYRTSVVDSKPGFFAPTPASVVDNMYGTIEKMDKNSTF